MDFTSCDFLPFTCQLQSILMMHASDELIERAAKSNFHWTWKRHENWFWIYISHWFLRYACEKFKYLNNTWRVEKGEREIMSELPQLTHVKPRFKLKIQSNSIWFIVKSYARHISIERADVCMFDCAKSNNPNFISFFDELSASCWKIQLQ